LGVAYCNDQAVGSDNQRIVVRFMAWAAEFTVVSTHTGCGIHPSLYLVGISGRYL